MKSALQIQMYIIINLNILFLRYHSMFVQFLSKLRTHLSACGSLFYKSNMSACYYVLVCHVLEWTVPTTCVSLTWVQEGRQDVGIADEVKTLLCHHVAIFLPPLQQKNTQDLNLFTKRTLPETRLFPVFVVILLWLKS